MVGPIGVRPEDFDETQRTDENKTLPWEALADKVTSLADKVTSFVVGVFKVISAPIKPFVFLAAIPIQVILSTGVGVYRGYQAQKSASQGEKVEAFFKTLGKCALFGATYFFRPLFSSVGGHLFTDKGASYEWRNQIEKDLFVSGVPLKSDVSDIKKQLGEFTKEEFLAVLHKMCPDENNEKRKAIEERIKDQPGPFTDTDVSGIKVELGNTDPNIKTEKKFSKAQVLAQLHETFRDVNNPTRKAIEKEIENQDGPFYGVVFDVTERKELTLTLRGSPAEKEDWRKAGILYINIPSEDLKALDVDKNVDLARFANACREQGVGVLVHCAKGIGRSATVAVTMMAIKEQEQQDSGIGASDIRLSRSKKVEDAITTFKKARAYGLNPLQELSVYESKVQVLINDLEDLPVKSTLLMAFKTDNFEVLEEKAKQLAEEFPDLEAAVKDYKKAFDKGKAYAEKKGKDELDKFTLARAEKAVDGHLEYVKSLIQKDEWNVGNKAILSNLLDLNGTKQLSTPHTQEALSIPRDINLALTNYIKAYDKLTELASTNKQKAYTLSLERLEKSLNAGKIVFPGFPLYTQPLDATIQSIKDKIKSLQSALTGKRSSDAAKLVYELKQIQLEDSPIKDLVDQFTKKCLDAHPKVRKELERQARARGSG